MRADGSPTTDTIDALARFIEERSSLFVLTGAGCSTSSGIPDYRDENGDWKRPQPVTYAAFTGSAAVRKRYWARSMVGWPTMANARPNGAHAGLARIQARGHVQALVTQNVDGLHQAAGSKPVLDLHGRIADVVCLACGARTARDALQVRLLARNPDWQHLHAATAPDGDADLETDTRTFDVPPCTDCGGILKPDVVFFGENVPGVRVQQAYDAVASSDGALVVGSSLRVFSGWRFVRDAAERGLPVAILNLGKTRADDVATLKVELPCADALAALTEANP